MSAPPSPGHPHGCDQTAKRNEKFCDSVLVSLVGELAARYNGNKKCRISPAAKSGHGFMCYNVTFPDEEAKQWVVRIAMPTALDNQWDIVQGEVATIEYIRRHTSIPVPTVHAHGTNERLTKDLSTTQSWVITDRLHGKPLSADLLLLMTRAQRKRLFTQLADIFAQLLGLTFPKTGSLYPNETDNSKGLIGPSLCRFDQILGIRDGVVRRRPTFTTAWDCIQHHLLAMRDSAEMRNIDCGDYVKDDIAHQILAVDGVERHFKDESHAFWREQTEFSLSHGSFTSDRVFVDDDGDIQGIVNWSLAEILPRQLCQPPNWILNTGSSPRDRQDNPIWEEFQEAVTPDHPYYKHLQYYLENEKHIGFASILRCPTYLNGVYFWDKMYDMQHKEPARKLLAKFFSKPENQAELDRQLADQKAHHADIIVRMASALRPRLLQTRDWFVETQNLIKVSSQLGQYISEPLPGSPVLSVDSGSSRASSGCSHKSGATVSYNSLT